jgi:hypothetical protein
MGPRRQSAMQRCCVGVELVGDCYRVPVGGGANYRLAATTWHTVQAKRANSPRQEPASRSLQSVESWRFRLINNNAHLRQIVPATFIAGQSSRALRAARWRSRAPTSRRRLYFSNVSLPSFPALQRCRTICCFDHVERSGSGRARQGSLKNCSAVSPDSLVFALAGLELHIRSSAGLIVGERRSARRIWWEISV